MDPLQNIFRSRGKEGQWLPTCSAFELGVLSDNLDTLARFSLLTVVRRLGGNHNALFKRVQQLEGAVAPSQSDSFEVSLRAFDERIRNVEATLEASAAARAKLELALADLAARCGSLAERHQTAIDQHLEALTAHFGGGFAEIAAARDLIAASAIEAKEAAKQAAGVLDEVRDEYAAARDAIPRLADHAVREVVSAIEEEPGILALALGNAQSFTSTIAKTVER